MYTKPHKYTDAELLEAQLFDDETDLRCAIRDGLPEDYIERCREKVVKGRKALELRRKGQGSR